MTEIDVPAFLATLTELMVEAGRQVLDVYEQSDCHIVTKEDGSPQTLADRRAEEILLAGLRRLTPAIPVIAEESYEAGPASVRELFWLVDPLDGTREFIDRNGQFTINAALIHRGQPILGAVHAPALDTLYTGALGHGAFVRRFDDRRPLQCRICPEEGITVVGSRSHNDPTAMQGFLANYCVKQFLAAGSSLKFCMVAEGSADLYPRLGRTMEWDTAAGHAVLLAAGGEVLTLDHQPLAYGKSGHENPHFYARATRREIA
ncbi:MULTISPECIES: 3'(2'),5'-bisphosphate nucleotidase CysQ [unclassified Achromobacter]|uniref:3'(2'),5'-bisphosphate nucleotidase CysQ n=1 Tax=unclassified Achromobacter TaxID=2626865 RepID=UPI000B51C8E7|nr:MULTISPECIES: 3'(2'),5'-bisphosphate nucleotidase CysQ [unclassified Achromobacter]OWT74964.1 3'(2'),5'-bisphosphate nucleotidase [Achromobacter sp. HZ28]OWT76572.1 3'(2'),5'-bisphosphate nucleotidase [Achromobacter sp. HZ34]